MRIVFSGLRVTLALLLALTAGCAHHSRTGGRSSAAEDDARQRLSQRISVDFDQTPLVEALAHIRGAAGIDNMFVNWRALETAGIDAQTPVTLQLNNVAATRVLDLLLSYIGGDLVPLSYELGEAGVLKIATHDALAKETFIRIYPIGDLVQVQPTGQAPQLEGLLRLAEIPPVEAEPQNICPVLTSRDELLLGLMDLIRNSVDPDNWREAGGLVSSMEVTGSGETLVITTGKQNHDAVAALLADLRSARPPQYQIDARVLLLSDTVMQRFANSIPAAGDDAPDPHLDHAQVSRLLDAVGEDPQSIIMAAPRLTAFSGQQAFVTSGRQVLTPAGKDAQGRPQFAARWQGLFVEVDGAVNRRSRQVALILRVLLKGSGSSTDAADPTHTRDELVTRVLVPDGATLVLAAGKVAGNPLEVGMQHQLYRQVVVLITATIAE